MYINLDLQIIIDYTHFLPLNASRFSSATNLKRIRLSSPVGTTTWSGRNFDAERYLTNASPFQELGHLQPRIIEVEIFRNYLYMRFASRFEIRVFHIHCLEWLILMPTIPCLRHAALKYQLKSSHVISNLGVYLGPLEESAMNISKMWEE